MKCGLSLGKAVEVINGLTVPSELINSVEVAEALRMGAEALNKQIEIGILLQAFKDEYNPTNRYSEDVVMEFLNDGYMLSEVNNIDG